MANRFPLIVDTDDGNKIKELPSGDFLDMTSSGLANLNGLTLSGTLATGNATVSGTLNVTGTAQFTSLDATSLTINGSPISSTQIQSDYNETDTESAAFIRNKPDIPDSPFDFSDFRFAAQEGNTGDVLELVKGDPPGDSDQWSIRFSSVAGGGINYGDLSVRPAVGQAQLRSGIGSLVYNDGNGEFTMTFPNIGGDSFIGVTYGTGDPGIVLSWTNPGYLTYNINDDADANNNNFKGAVRRSLNVRNRSPNYDGAADAGELRYDNTTGEFDFIPPNLSAGGGGLADLVSDTSPQLGGDLDLNVNNITGVGNIDVTGSLAASSGLTISAGLTRLQGGTEIEGYLQIEGSSLSNTDILVTKNTNGLIGSVSGFTIDGSGNLSIPGTTTASGNMSVTGDITATGTITAASVVSGGTGTPSISAAGDFLLEVGGKLEIRHAQLGIGAETSLPTSNLANGDFLFYNTTGTFAIYSNQFDGDGTQGWYHLPSRLSPYPLALPNLSTSQRNAITGKSGHMIFNSDNGNVEVHDGSGWRTISI
jgi:hypothetical protein